MKAASSKATLSDASAGASREGAASTKEGPTSERRTMLLDGSKEAGRLWALSWFEALQAEGRTVCGGWPGTMSEARGRARVHLDALLNKRAMPRINHAELTEAARLTYDSAKALWVGNAVRDEGVA